MQNCSREDIKKRQNYDAYYIVPKNHF